MSPLNLDRLPGVHIETAVPDHTLPETPWETVHARHGTETFRFCRWQTQTAEETPITHAMLLIHGLGGKPEWMSAFATTLLYAQSQLAKGERLVIYAVDMPAYGAENPRGEGHIESYPQLLDRLDACWTWLMGQHPDVRLLPLGLSLGGLVMTHWATRTLQKQPLQVLRQLALISPAFKASPISFNPMFYAVVIVRFALETLKLLPQGTLPLPYANEWTDPTIVRTLTVKGYWELLKMTLFATPRILGQLKQVDLPIWLGVAEQDTICDPQAMVNAYRQWPSTKKRLVVFPNAAHDLVLDPAMPSMAQDLMHWWISDNHSS